jgi:TP901 family phage tail tape measure protein
MLSHAEALNAVAAATKLTIATTTSAAEAQAEMEPTTRTLTSLYVNFGGSLSAYADQMAKLQTQYSFKSIEEVTNALSYAAPAAKAAGISVSEMMTSIGLLSAGGKYSAEAGTMFESFVDKLGSDSRLAGFVQRTAAGGIAVQRTIQGLAAVFGSLPAGPERMRELTAVGFDERSAAALSIMIDKVTQFGKVNNDLANSSGTAGSKSATMMATLSEKIAVVANQWTNFKVLIGGALAPSIGTLVAGLGKVLEKLTAFASAHPMFVKFAVLAAAATAGVLALGGAIALAAAALAGIAATVGVSALLILPIAAAIGAVAAAAFLVYRHWGEILGWIEGLGSRWFQAGFNLVKAIGAGIAAAVMYPIHAIADVAAKIRAHLPFSPAQVGPLRDLGHVKIVETIAQSIRPGPMLQAIRRTAAVAAIAVPMAIGAGAMPAAATTTRAEVPVVVNLNVSYTINGVESGDLKKVLEKHGYELAETLNRELERRRRTDF